MEIRSPALTVNPYEHGVPIDFTLPITPPGVSGTCGVFESASGNSPPPPMTCHLSRMCHLVTLSSGSVALAAFTFKIAELKVIEHTAWTEDVIW
jgi:hypothetical protein